MGFISTDRKQINLLGYSLDDFVPSNAECRFEDIQEHLRRCELPELDERCQ